LGSAESAYPQMAKIAHIDKNAPPVKIHAHPYKQFRFFFSGHGRDDIFHIVRPKSLR